MVITAIRHILPQTALQAMRTTLLVPGAPAPALAASYRPAKDGRRSAARIVAGGIHARPKPAFLHGHCQSRQQQIPEGQVAGPPVHFI